MAWGKATVGLAAAVVLLSPCGAAAQMLSGTYVGTGLDNESITGLGFRPDVVIVKGDSTQIGVIRTSTMVGDASKPMTGGTALTANLIQSLNATGFTVGSDARVNAASVNYYWVAFKAAPGKMAVGTYTGNGTAPRSITGVGFPGETVFVMSAGATRPVAVTATSLAAGSNGLDFFTTSAGGWFQSLDADGFTLGSSAAEVNANGTTYHFVVFNDVDGQMRQGTYVGNGADNRNITGLGFSPEYVITFSSNVQEATQHSGGVGAAVDSTMFFAGIAGMTNRVQALLADGFQVGSALDVNENTRNHFYVAWSRNPGPPQILSGTYTGNGADNRAITGLGFRPDFVIVKGQTAQTGVFRSSRMAGDRSKPATGPTAVAADLVQTLDADGFTVGTDARVNGSGVVYHWIAFSGGAGEMVVNNYTGNGVDNRSLSGLGFQPEYVIVMSEAANDAVHRSSAMAGDISFEFDTSASTANAIQALQADGFQVGTDARVNANGTVYQFVAWNQIAGKMEVGSYAGNTTDDRNITGVGFQPEYVIVRPSSANSTVHHSTAMGAATDLSERFWASAGLSNAIQALQADGFQVGTDATVNTSPNTYYWMAWKRPALTAIRLASARATRGERGVTLTWRTGFELDNLGFDVHREWAGLKTRITGRLIAGTALSLQPGVAAASGHAYQWTDESEEALVAGVRYWLEDVDLNGTRTWHGPIEPRGARRKGQDADEAPRTTYGPPRDRTDVAVAAESAENITDSPALQELAAMSRGSAEQGPGGTARSYPPRLPVYSGWLGPIVRGRAAARASSSTTAVSTSSSTAPVEGETAQGTPASREDGTSAAQTPLSSTNGSSSPAGTPRAPGGVTARAAALPPPPPRTPAKLRIRRPTVTTTLTAAPGQPSAMQAAQLSLAAGPAARIEIRVPGWYRVTQPMLIAAGLDPAVDPRKLRLFTDGRELPLRYVGDQEDAVFDAADALEFYGVGIDTPFSDRRPYWIAAGASPGLRLGAVAAALEGVPPAGSTFAHTVERRDRTVFFGALQNGEAENFFGPLIMQGEVVAQELTLPYVAPVAGPARLEVALQGVTSLAAADDHHVAVLVNGNEVGQVVFDGRERASASLDIAQALLTSGANTVGFESRGGPDDITLLEGVRLMYEREYRAEGDELTVPAAPGSELRITGFSNGSIRVVGVADGVAFEELVGTIASEEDGTWSVRLSVPAGGLRTLLATAAEPRVPAAIAANAPSSLHAAGQAGKVVMITDRRFAAALEPLRALRESQGSSVQVVDVQDVYDEFAFGAKTPAALREFLARAAKAWREPPRFVLLVGNATTDPRNYLGLGEEDFVPTRIVSTGAIETASDEWFVDGDGDGIGELAAIGRLPARTVEHVTTMVDKIVSYERSSSESWHNAVLLVSDAGDDEPEEFASLNDAAGALVPAGYEVHHLKRGEDAAAASTLRTRLAEGALLVSYQGHGSVDLWRDDVLTSASAGSLDNGSRLPFVVAMTCFSGFFHGLFPEESVAEALLRAPQGGAVAVWASSGMTDSRWQSSMNRELFRQMFRGRWLSIGDAVRAAKTIVGDPDVRRTWIYFGDPALRVKGLSRPPVENAPTVSSVTAPPAAEDPGDDAVAEDDSRSAATGRPRRLADFDGDGFGDAFITERETGSWFAALGQPGTFRYVPGQFLHTGHAAAVNLNGDAHADLFLYDPADGAWQQALGRGDGTFLVSRGRWGVGLKVLTADFDGNGLDDVFAYQASGAWTQAYTIDGNDFSYRSGSGLQTGDARAGDFNGDGRSDVFVYDPNDGRWTVMLSTAEAPTITTGTWTPGWQALVANLNGDEFADVVLWDAPSGMWVQCLRQASGAFAYRTGASSPGGRLHAANFSGDSRDELFRYDVRTGDWTLTSTAADGTATQIDGLWEAGWELTPGRLNADARDDLLLYNPATGDWIRRVNLPSAWIDEASGAWSRNWFVTGREK